MPRKKLYIYWNRIALAAFSVLVSISFFLILHVANAQSTISSINQNALCKKVNFEELANIERPTLNSAILETESPIIPDGEVITVKVFKPSTANTIFCARIHNLEQQVKPLEVITAKNSSDGYTILSVKIPEIGWKVFYVKTRFDLVSIQFDESSKKYEIGSPDIYISQDVRISCWLFSFIGSVAAVIVAYLGAAIAIYHLKKNQDIKEFFRNILSYLDLVVFTSDYSGKANISSLQITWFTLIVFGLLVHILLRTGELSPISDDILWLLGISATGKILSRGIDVYRNQLSLENRAWLHHQGWLKDTNQSKVAKWGDLIMTDSSFDVYKYQLLVFSLIIGITLTISGLNALTTFSLPQGFINLLGLSNAVYIFGKTTSPNSVMELNQHINELRKFEKEYLTDPQSYKNKAGDVASMLIVVYGKEFTKFNNGITDSSLEPIWVKQRVSNE